MIRALIKKQLLELVSSLFRNRKNKKSAIGTTLAIFALLFVFVAGVYGYLFYMMAQTMYAGLAPIGYTWLYFSFFGVFAFGLGLIGSVFMTYSTLYNSRDNDLLLSMPIKPAYILLARTLGLYILTAVCEALILVPAEIQFVSSAGFSILQFLIFLLILVLLPLFTFVFSALLGYVIALIAPKVKNKSVVSIVVSVIFLGLYFFIYFRFNRILDLVLSNTEGVSSVVRYAFFPFYALGRALTGEVLYLLLYCALAVGAFALVYMILQRSFIRLATTPAKTVRKEYKGEIGHQASPGKALLKKEFSRYFSCPSYILNTAISVLMLAVAVIASIINKNMLLSLFASLPRELIPLLPVIVTMMLSGLASTTSPSISLEGQSLPILRSLPLSSARILHTKLCLHLIVIAVPSAICHTALCFVLIDDPAAAAVATLAVLPVLYISGVFGLIFNLRHPYLDWANEAVAVKQSSSVIFTMLATLGVVSISVGSAVLTIVQAQLSAIPALLIIISVGLIFDIVFTAVLETWGKRRFDTL